MLLTMLKFVGLLWLGVLVASTVILATLYVLPWSARAIRRRLLRRR
jgi:hypothetical protein